MIEVNNATPALRRFRSALLMLALVLTCQATWILVVEIYRPPRFVFPATEQAATAAANNRDSATLAASIGIIRGDLWAECALTYLDLFWDQNRSNDHSQVLEMIDRARDIAERALTLSPHDARIWLVKAAMDWRRGALNQKVAAALRMSYYTGANEIELIPFRLALAVRSDAVEDEDFQELVSHDIRVIISRRPELKTAIQAAYREALPRGRQVIERTLAQMDPALRAQLQSN
jgi:hypothetical protein